MSTNKIVMTDESIELGRLESSLTYLSKRLVETKDKLVKTRLRKEIASLEKRRDFVSKLSPL